MSLIVACEDLGVLGANPITAGQILDLPQSLARAIVKAGLAAKVYSYSLAVYPVRLPSLFLRSPIHLHVQTRHPGQRQYNPRRDRPCTSRAAGPPGATPPAGQGTRAIALGRGEKIRVTLHHAAAADQR